MYPLCLIPKEILVPSEYNKFVDATGIATPVPETVLTVKLNKDADLFVASSTIKTLSAESGIVTFLFAVKVPVSLKYKFLPFDTAPLDNANATSADATSTAIYPDTACSNCCKLVLVMVPQVPDFSPVVINSNFKSLEYVLAIFLLWVIWIYWNPNTSCSWNYLVPVYHIYGVSCKVKFITGYRDSYY